MTTTKVPGCTCAWCAPTAEQLQALGALTMEMFACDRLYWTRHFPVAMVNAIANIEGAQS